MDIVTKLVNPIIHITLEQRNQILRQLTVSCSMMAVLKCGVKSKMITAAMQVADIIKNSSNKNSIVCHKHNVWQRKTSQSFKELLNNAKTTLNNKVTQLLKEVAKLKENNSKRITSIGTNKQPIVKNPYKATSPLNLIDVTDNKTNDTSITHPTLTELQNQAQSPVSSLTHIESSSSSTTKNNENKNNKLRNTTQQRQQNEDAIVATASAKGATQLEDELLDLQEQVGTNCVHISFRRLTFSIVGFF